MRVKLVVDSHVWFEHKKLKKEDLECFIKLRKTFNYANPDYYKFKALRLPLKGVRKRIQSFTQEKHRIKFSRGCLSKIKKILKQHGHTAKIIDERLKLEVVDFGSKIKLHKEQIRPVERMLKKEQGSVRGPCSSGKTVMLLEAIAKAAQPTVVIVWNITHQEHWISEIKKFFTLLDSEIGGVGGCFKKRRLGKINVCMQQSLSNKANREFFSGRTGFVAGDESQRYGAKTYVNTINNFPARYRIGVSANERRKDRKEFLIYDGFGPIIANIKDTNIGSRKKANVFLVPTHFKSEEYAETKNWPQLLTDICGDGRRNKLIVRCIKRSLKRGKLCLVLTERKAHALWFKFKFEQYRTGLLLGSTTKKEIKGTVWPKRWKKFMLGFDSDIEFNRVKSLGEKRKLDLIIGTQKGDVGLNIRTLDHLFVTTPTGNNIERFSQQKGRVERDYDKLLEKKFGTKDIPSVFYFWDARVEKLQNAGNNILKAYPKSGVLKLKGKRNG